MAQAVISELEAEIGSDLDRFAVPGASWALIEGGEIVHASSEQGKVVQERHPADLKKRLRTVRRVFDADD